jgi:hypothetical protein
MAILAILVISTLAVIPGQAWAEIDSDPEPSLAPITSFREHYVMSLNGVPLMWCEADWESPVRHHGVCGSSGNVMRYWMHSEVENVAQTVEYVEYDGTAYWRVDDEEIWTTSPIHEEYVTTNLSGGGDFTNRFTVNSDAILTNMGPTAINDIPVQHYQYWIKGSTVNTSSGNRQVETGQAVYDLFLNEQNMVIADKFTSVGFHEDYGYGTLEFYWTYTDINAPIIVTAPPASITMPGDDW